LKELDELKDQLNKAKKDNLCIRIAYERWKQTYESLDVLKGKEQIAPHEASLDEETQ
jgi:hypothetical protein